jgi:alginate O-acetyltransferase complex protein AlgJ
MISIINKGQAMHHRTICNLFVSFFCVVTFTAAAAGDDPAAAFRTLCAQKAAAGEDMTIVGKDGWLFLRSELRHIGAGPFWGEAAAKISRASSPDKSDPLPAIVDFHEQLKAIGIELIFAPVPCKALVYADKLGAPTKGRLDTVHQDFYKMLVARGVKVVDLADAFAEEKANGPALYCKTDTHWSPYACELAAKLVKERLGSPTWLQAKPGVFKTAVEKRKIVGDLTEGTGSEELPTRVVTGADTTLAEGKASPVLLLGDSHTLVFHTGQELHGTGAGLADQLAAELGIAVDVIGVRGSGATPARVNLLRRAKSDAGYLSGKKLIVWCFAAHEFTESPGWSLVPFSSVAKPARTAP